MLPQLQQAMRDQGGYSLHLDGTCEGGGPRLMSSLDSLSELVLGKVKVPSEKTAQIIPFLEEIKRRSWHQRHAQDYFSPNLKLAAGAFVRIM